MPIHDDYIAIRIPSLGKYARAEYGLLYTPLLLSSVSNDVIVEPIG